MGDLKKSPMLNHRHDLNVSTQLNRTELLQLDYWPRITEQVTRRASDDIFKKIYDELDSFDDNIIDLSDHKTYTKEFFDEFSSNLRHIIYDKKLVISSASVAASIQDQYDFGGIVQNGEIRNERIYNIGKYVGVDIMVDSQLSWSDNFLYTFDDFGYDYSLIGAHIDENGLLIVKFSFDYIIVNPEKFYIFTTELSSNQDVLLKHNRSKKIKKILGDE